MPFTPTNFQDGNPATPVSAANLNKLGGQYAAVAADAGNPATPVGAALSATIVPGVNPASTGAVGNDVADDTAALLAAISAANGNTVVARGGARYVIDSLSLLSGARIDLNGATLVQRNASAGSSDGAAIRNGNRTAGAPTVKNIHISNGTLEIGADAQGRAISFAGVSGLRLENIDIVKGAATFTDWFLHFFNCDHVILTNCRVWGGTAVGEDGIHLTACQDVTITGGSIEAGDDAIALVQEFAISERPTQDVTISNVTVKSRAASYIKVLVESGETHGIHRVNISNIVGTNDVSANGVGVVINDGTNSGLITGVSLDGIKLDYQNKTGVAVAVTNVNGISLKNVEVTSVNGSAFVLTNAHRAYLEGCRATARGGANDQYVFNNSSGRAVACEANGSTLHGFRIHGASSGHWVFVACSASTPTNYGYYVYNTTGGIELIACTSQGGTSSIAFEAAAPATDVYVIGGRYTGQSGTAFANAPADFVIWALNYDAPSGRASRINGRLGFNAAPIAKPAAYTQTYATASRTHGAYTPDVENVAYTGSPADAPSTAKLADLNALRLAYENLRVSHESTKAVLNQVIDDLQAYGLLQ